MPSSCRCSNGRQRRTTTTVAPEPLPVEARESDLEEDKVSADVRKNHHDSRATEPAVQQGLDSGSISQEEKEMTRNGCRSVPSCC
ncbi:hypothetical protein JOB18_037754 [Solea senegalensis]|uniref:Uncharacterized protein n=1 Tax=Solea senegalensis TaxID=28829 RepID=A0AAV6S563_SOLSE|nr:hypothetical protein JOB18_037754 [Solea senegalensis]